MAKEPETTGAAAQQTDWPEDDSGAYTVSVAWRSRPDYESEAGTPARGERHASRAVSAETARAILRLMREGLPDDDPDSDRLFGGI
jgi:hypothetical protein